MYRLKPIYHFMPKKNWMNDPNGTIYYKGEYHLFYQYNPFGYTWQNMHWGHAKSKDLIYWERLPIALYPSNEKGELHCFSGCCVIKDDQPVIIYTTIGQNRGSETVEYTLVDGKLQSRVLGAQQWMATGSSDMLTWEKYNDNPLIDVDIHGDMDIKEWRDPFVWKEDNTWYMVIAGVHGKEGCILIYKSEDLKNWVYLNKLYKEEDVVLECPNIVVFGDMYLLIYSVTEEKQVKYCVGKMSRDYTLKVEENGYIDSGKSCYYATNICLDGKNRVILWGWLNESARGELENIGEWAGIQCLPRVLEYDGSNGLIMRPVPEVESIRGNQISLKDYIIVNEVKNIDLRGKAFEIQAEFHLGKDVKNFGFKLLCSPDGQEKTIINFNIIKNTFSIIRDKSSISKDVIKDNIDGDFNIDGDKLKVHIYVDYSSLEVFVDYRKCMSARVYPLLEESELIYIYTDGELKINKLDAWELNSIW